MDSLNSGFHPVTGLRVMSLKVRKNLSQPPPERCPLSACMSILGGLWTANIIWYLTAGPRRFNELRIDIPKISPKIPSARLRFLEAQGVVERTVKATSPPSVEYSLTKLGGELIPAIEAIVSVGHRLKSRPVRLSVERNTGRAKYSPALSRASPSP